MIVRPPFSHSLLPPGRARRARSRFLFTFVVYAATALAIVLVLVVLATWIASDAVVVRG